jgi:hypothetical protein
VKVNENLAEQLLDPSKSAVYITGTSRARVLVDNHCGLVYVPIPEFTQQVSGFVFSKNHSIIKKLSAVIVNEMSFIEYTYNKYLGRKVGQTCSSSPDRSKISWSHVRLLVAACAVGAVISCMVFALELLRYQFPLLITRYRMICCIFLLFFAAFRI